MKNDNLSKTEKINCLKSYLTSIALNAVDELEISEVNYDTAVQILETHFIQKDMIIDHHMNKLLNLSPIFKSCDIFRLKMSHDNIELNVLALSALV